MTSADDSKSQDGVSRGSDAARTLVNPFPGPEHPDPLQFARRLSQGMDTAVRIPRTQITVGLDAVLGLIPGVGDVAGAVISAYLVILAARLRVPKPIIMRMLVNVVIDAVTGVVPLIGDLFDVAFKANRRNFRMLEQYLEPVVEKPRRGYLRILAVIAVVSVVLGLCGLAAMAILSLLSAL